MAEGGAPEHDGSRGSASLLGAGVLLSYGALLVALLAVLAPTVRAVVVALLLALGAVGCYLRYRRPESHDHGEPTSPASQLFRERPVFFTSRLASIFCGVFFVSSSAGAVFLRGGWTAPIAYGTTAAIALIITLRSRKRAQASPQDLD